MSEIDIARVLLSQLDSIKSQLMDADPPYQKPVKPTFRTSQQDVVSCPLPEEFLCKICGDQQVDPRVLGCFHSFCLACIRDWLERQIAAIESPGVSKYELMDGSGSSCGSASVSGYESDVARDSSLRRRRRKESVACPVCGVLTKIPVGGLSCLPLHYVLQHPMLLASVNQETVMFYCDLCPTEIAAVLRCTTCLVNLCHLCCNAHQRQPNCSGHDVIGLKEPGKHSGVQAIRRQLMCPFHPDQELILYCITCGQLLCRDRCVLSHRGHEFETVPRAAPMYASRVREQLEKARQVHKASKYKIEKISTLSHKIELRCQQVEDEINTFLEAYQRNLDEHGRQLRSAVEEARRAKLLIISQQQQQVARSLSTAEQVVKFGDDLLHEGSEAEILSFARTLTSKLDECLKKGEKSSALPDLKVLETINFLPEEKASSVLLTKPMYGVVTTQRVSATTSSLEDDALAILNNVRQQQRCEVLLISRDSDGQVMCHGGEPVRADIRYRDLTRRSLPVSIADNQDGTYSISFVPDSPGNMNLEVYIRGTAIKGSPFPVCVRTLRSHHGIFHCCSFCSSSGKKEVVCGCGGNMPGGFKGCGHGHAGHPGRRHWSCCGNTLYNSECGRPPPTLYHISF